MTETIVISDTNILIDLAYVDMIATLTETFAEVCTTDFVIHEMRTNKKAVTQMVMLGKIDVKSLDAKAIFQIQELYDRCNTNASVTDCSVWYLAKTLGATLLTGDAKLMDVVQNDNVPVHGILYVFDCVIESGIIKPTIAAEKLSALLSHNIRLPRSECQKRIALWSAMEHQ